MHWTEGSRDSVGQEGGAALSERREEALCQTGRGRNCVRQERGVAVSVSKEEELCQTGGRIDWCLVSDQTQTCS